MQTLVRSGVRVGDAAEAARAWQPPTAESASGPEIAEPFAGVEYPDRDDLVRGLVASATALDARAASLLVRRSLDTRGVLWTWDQVLRPVLVQIGQNWARTGNGVEVEHLLSEVASKELSAVVMRLAPRSTRPALLACAPREDHDLPLHAVAAALAERGMEARFLGPRTPVSALAAAVRRLGPSSVFIWAYLPLVGDDPVAALPKLRPEPLVVLAGPGWPPERAAGTCHVSDLASAVTRLVGAA
jgi:hypothetical protein